MAGFKYIFCSGIGGDFISFSNFLNVCSNDDYLFIPYDRTRFFVDNISIASEQIQKFTSIYATNDIIIVGWSIGGVLALAIANNFIFKKVIAINSFFSRSDALLNKIIVPKEDDICISDFSIKGHRIYLIAGQYDEKIPVNQTYKIFEALKLTNHVSVHIVKRANPSLTTIPQKMPFFSVF